MAQTQSLSALSNEVTQVLGVELKNSGGNSVNLGTLGKAMTGYGGSIGRIANSAPRFIKSSNEQLRLESQAIQDALNSREFAECTIYKRSKCLEWGCEYFQ